MRSNNVNTSSFSRSHFFYISRFLCSCKIIYIQWCMKVEGSPCEFCPGYPQTLETPLRAARSCGSTLTSDEKKHIIGWLGRALVSGDAAAATTLDVLSVFRNHWSLNPDAVPPVWPILPGARLYSEWAEILQCTLEADRSPCVRTLLTAGLRVRAWKAGGRK